MSIKKIVRKVFISAALAAACALPALSGCAIKTSHPSAKITLSFNGTEYVLNYKLYRNMYPQTVQHFIELADSGFYDNTIIHNYTSSNWYGGGYAYNESYKTDYADNGMADYLETYSKEEIYEDLFNAGKLTPSVYKSYINDTYTDALSTLIGEFNYNGHEIENGALSSSYGCLRMYYSAKNTDEVVYLKKSGNEKKEILGQYSYNSATSLINIQVDTSVATDNYYCIFGVLKDTEDLEELQEAISDYLSDNNLTSTSFTSSASLFVDNYDRIIGKRVNAETFYLTAEPIVVTSVKITKY